MSVKKSDPGVALLHENTFIIVQAVVTPDTDRANPEPCGCKVFVGIRIDDSEPACSAFCCPDNPAHVEAMHRWEDFMRVSLDHPTNRGLIEVTDIYLQAAYWGSDDLPPGT